MINKQFNRWMVIEKSLRKNYFRCRCECGVEKEVFRGNITSGKSKSCGCFRDEQAEIRGYDSITTHGMSKTAEFRTWTAMKERCYSNKCRAYKYYGARGIRVCDRWLTSFTDFYKDMGNRPSENHTLDRINCDGNYAPDNCRWATHKEQANNKRNTAHVEYNGETKTLSEWVELTKLPHKTLCHRYQRGWLPERMLTQPLRVTSVTTDKRWM